MKSRYWLSICAVGALVVGFEIGGCSSDSGLSTPDGGKKDSAASGGTTGGLARLDRAAAPTGTATLAVGEIRSLDL